MKESKNKKIENFKVVLVLVLIATIAGVILGIVKPLTDIDQEKVFKTNLKLITDQTFPNEEYEYRKLNEDKPFEKPDQDSLNQVISVVKITPVNSETKIKNAYLFEVKGKQAYKATITMYVLINDNKIVNIAVKESSETPGLGSKVLTDKYYNSSYIGRDVFTITDEFKIVKNKATKNNEIVAQNGATKTSTGLKNSINGAVRVYKTLVVKGE